VITQDPMMIRSCGLSSTFSAMPVLHCRPYVGHPVGIYASIGFVTLAAP
jgi:hypothetical protein